MNEESQTKSNQSNPSAIIGAPVDRVDGQFKVKGVATYSAEYKLPNLAHAVLIGSRIAKGRISSIDTAEAMRAPGVLLVLTPRNMPRPPQSGGAASDGSKPAENKRLPLSDDSIHYANQHVAVVVAETLEQAEHAARLVRFDYAEEKPAIVMEREKSRGERPEQFNGSENLQIKRGQGAANFAAAPVRVDRTYSTPSEHHNPIEPHATIAVWDGPGGNEKLTVYDATQYVVGSQKILASMLGISETDVRVVTRFVGGGFGCKGQVWAHPMLAAIAARQLKRPVKLVLTRQQMFTSNGHRGETSQRVALGADRQGKLQSVIHETTTHQSEVGDFIEPCGLTTNMLYAAPNVEIAHTGVRLNVGTPTFMRAPGESPGMFALESAMDELAYALKIDPIELRLINHADRHPHDSREWSSKNLKDCYRVGAETIGWSKRNAQPRANRSGRFLTGYGMATATYPGYRSPASARARMMADGSAVVQTATTEIGTGTYTVMTQVAADVLGLPVERVRCELGDSQMPPAPIAAGSMTVASVGPAINNACEALRNEIINLAIKDKGSPLYNRREDEIAVGGGRLFVANDASRGENYAEIVRRSGRPSIEVCVTARIASKSQENSNGTDTHDGRGTQLPLCYPNRPNSETDSDQQRYAFQSFGAQFCEVRVDEDLGIVKVTRFVSVQDVGRILNEKTAQSQVRSGVIYGIGMALMEESAFDSRNARPVVRTLADYHFPAHLDIPNIEVRVINRPDPHINSLGARGIGEIGITGVAAAVANAVFNATGKRIRDLPLTPDKLL